MFFIFAGLGRISVFLNLYIKLLSFLFSLSFTYCKNSEIKVTVKLTGSTVIEPGVDMRY